MGIRAEYYVECDAGRPGNRRLGCHITCPGDKRLEPAGNIPAAMDMAKAGGWKIDTQGCRQGECVATCPVCQGHDA